MEFLNLTLPTASENVALDEALLLECEADARQPVLRVWEWPYPAVVLGAGCSVEHDVHITSCKSDGVPILRRASGGGTVLLGAGCLLYSLVMACDDAPELRQIKSSYCFILKRACKSLEVPGLDLAGVSDLAINSQKVSGNAQQRKRSHFLHHGTLLHAFDIGKVDRYLRMPLRQPSYRQRRPDTAFLTNLPLSREDILKRLRDGFGATKEVKEWPADMVKELISEKYSLATWTDRR